jgi:hypothetical protein
LISQQDAQGYAFEKLARHGAALSKNMNTHYIQYTAVVDLVDLFPGKYYWRGSAEAGK